MATIEAAPTATHPTPFLSPLAPFFHMSFSLSLLMPSKNWRGMAFVSSAGVPGGWKGATRLWLPTIGEGGYSAWDPPPVAGLDPHESASHSWAIDPLWLNAITLCVARYTQETLPMLQRSLFLVRESMLRYSSTLYSSPDWFEVGKEQKSVEWCQNEWENWTYSGNGWVNTDGENMVHEWEPCGDLIKFQNTGYVKHNSGMN